MTGFLARGAVTGLLFGFALSGALSTAAHAGEKRCAFDVGSGETKVSAAEVDNAEPAPKTVNFLERKVFVPFTQNLKDGIIPDALIEEAIRKITELRIECERFGAKAFAGVATSGFRMARNGPAALDRITEATGVPLRIISGDQEAILAFRAAATQLRSAGDHLLVWDIGGGSLQFCMRAGGGSGGSSGFIVSSGHDGVELFRKAIAATLGRNAAQPLNPLNRTEMTKAVELAEAASLGVRGEIRRQLRRGDMRIVGLGGVHTGSLSLHAGLKGGDPYKFYTVEGVRTAAGQVANMSDEQFQKKYPGILYPENQAAAVALVLGYMEGLGIDRVIPLRVTLADGVLVDATFWPRQVNTEP